MSFNAREATCVFLTPLAHAPWFGRGRDAIRIERRVGIMVMQWRQGGCRPASDVEIALYRAWKRSRK